MSAWIVSNTCISLLVEACFRYECLEAPIAPDALGQLLWKENHRSVNYRYNEQRRTPRFHHDSTRRIREPHRVWPEGTWTYTEYGTIREAVRDPHLVYKQASCYRYQTCERDDWEQSQAYHIVDKLMITLCQATGLTADQMTETPEWEKRPWYVE